MTRNNPIAKGPFPHLHDGLSDRLAALGMSASGRQALLDLDAALFVWHRLAARGEVPRKLLAEIGIDLELSQFHSLTAILRIQNGVGRDHPEPATIGLLAEELTLDPSRASRIASDLIAAGYLRREAAQDDGRKSVLVLTGKAQRIFMAFRDLRFEKVLEIFEGWTDEEVTQFSGLFIRYVERLRDVFQADR